MDRRYVRFVMRLARRTSGTVKYKRITINKNKKTNTNVITDKHINMYRAIYFTGISDTEANALQLMPRAYISEYH